jgi:hypothetical protein
MQSVILHHAGLVQDGTIAMLIWVALRDGVSTLITIIRSFCSLVLIEFDMMRALVRLSDHSNHCKNLE